MIFPAELIVIWYYFPKNRVTNLCEGEKNFQIFYLILAGLSHDERGRNGAKRSLLLNFLPAVKYHLQDHAPQTLHYLNGGDVGLNLDDEQERFVAWRVSAAIQNQQL